MMSYVLSCCSTADLKKEHFESRDIRYICFHYSLGGVDYPDDLGQTISFHDFYKAMRDGADTQTSQINITEYLAYFTSLLEAGNDVLHVTLSSGLSGSINSARNAVAIAAERFPERKIYIIDSLGASSGYGLIMETLADMRDAGASIDELRDWLEENKLNMHHWFFSTDLSFYVKGGRISKAAGFFGGLLSVCPLLNMNHLGQLVPRAKIRGKQNVITEIVERMAQCADGGEQYNGKCYLCHSDCIEDAEKVAELVEKRF
ncbi:MAG: DegV family protein, partial [Clostridia bacterium]|nr:DegV family protein [Clostridia bacterium]